MVIRKIHPLRWWITLAVILMFIGIALPIGVAIGYTHNQIQHECAALNLLTSKPVPKPTDPNANPSREQNYLFYVDLVSWAKSDGC